MFPRSLRTDCGTENSIVADAQWFFHRDNENTLPHIYGSSHNNQRIEAWWAQLRRAVTDNWITFFKGLVEQGLFNCGNNTHIACARFCFRRVLQNSLDSFKEQWNSHYIRKSLSSEVHGRPDYNYLLPPEGFSEYGTAVVPNDLASVEDYVSGHLERENTNENFEEMEYMEYLDYLSRELHLSVPTNFEEARDNFVALLRAIEN